jgi:hypothetical protein
MSGATHTRRARVLLVAHDVADSIELASAVAERADRGPCLFTLLVPSQPRGLHKVVDPEDHGIREAQRRLDRALPVLTQAAGDEVVGIVGSHDPLAALQDALNLLGFDEVIISMLPARVSRWLHLDLPHKARGLGVPVSEVMAETHRPVLSAA